ncbi:hypothetical protein DBR32_01590 [Taibaiella sp. KBW10]|uniref:hypothetical protein n=1 Tax=Taibaiella sp. KBW10 TaxID=2153357 RepID=UPI000F5B57F2|nr:hypothetical protein [Taibaiella sp. KBW10]RQO32328.1 hypothetical protein DBR32_01590 [Taibaiella sp. KBW10]
MSVIIVSASATLNTAYFAAGNVYEFLNNHDLQTAAITLPANVTLRFKGGSLDNGMLIGTDTIIEAPRARIFGKNLAIEPTGTWKVDRAYSDWFDCYKDGYYIDPATFTYNAGTGTYQYKYAGTTFNAGELCGATFNNDRFMLQQLLNIGALHTIITEGVYMVDSLGGTGEHVANQLTWFGKKGLTLEIEGILKMIPNKHNNYNVLLVAECDNITLCGSGKLVGDLPEHQGTGGEAGMCLQVNSTVNMHLEDLTFEQGWGDGIYYSWRRYYSLTDKNKQEKHTWNQVKCLYNRRTGFAVEKGDYLSINNSDFNYTATFNGTATFSGVDIEPFGSDDTPQRYCKEIHFNQCRANYNKGTGFRFERLMGGSVTNSEASFNGGAAVETLECYFVNEDKVWGVHVTETDRRFFKNHIIIDANTFKDNWITFVSSNSSANITNNFIQNTSMVMNGAWQDSIVANNKVFNTGYVFFLSGHLRNLLFEHNYVEGIDCPNEGTAAGDSAAMFIIRQWGTPADHVSDVVVQNNTFKYAGGKIIYGSNDSQPMPYPSVKNYLFFVENGPTVEKIKFLDNHFDDELWAPEINTNGYTLFETAADPKIIQRRTFSVADLQKTKHLMKGDIIEAYGQKGLVTRGGWLETIGTTFANSTAYERYQIINDGMQSGMSLVVGAGTTAAGGGFPYGYGGSGTASIRPINIDYPVIVWQNLGTCTTGDRPTDFNTLGRTLVEINPGVSSQMIQWDGSAWVVL